VGAASVTAKFVGMTIQGKTYTEKEPAAKAILDACKELKTTEKTPVGSYMGFEMSLQFDSFNKDFKLSLRGSITHTVELGTDAFGNITRINNALANLPGKLAEARDGLERMESQQQAAQIELAKPFHLADELTVKEARLVELNAQLSIGDSPNVGEAIEGGEYSEDGADAEMSDADSIGNVVDYNTGKRTDFIDDSFSLDDDEDIAV